jgi:hypothetical protein
MQRFLLTLAISIGVRALPCLGQSYTANLTGVVADPAGAAVPAAKLKLENVATHEKRETKTGEEGRFTFSQLLPGIYQLQAEAAGFKAFVQSNINLVSGQSAALNFSMQIGEFSQRVEIGAAAVQVDTQTANQSVTLVPRYGPQPADQLAKPLLDGPRHRRRHRAGDRHLAVGGRSEPGPLRTQRRPQHDNGRHHRRRQCLGRQ